MKKLKLLLILLMLPLITRAASYDEVRLTFHRTGSDVGSVAVSVTDKEGTQLTDVTASLVGTSFDALKSAGADAIMNGSVLAPDNYENGQYSEISYLFRIEGLAADFSFDSADIDVYALNAGGNAQGNTGSTIRYFQFSVSTGASQDYVQAFAQKNVDTDICTVPNQSNGLYHSTQTMSATKAALATNPLYLRVTLIKTSQLGCYAGIGMVSLYTKESGSGEDPIEEGTFSADKTYTIHRNNNTAAYIYQSGTTMGTAQLDQTKMFWWSLIPTENTNCYYIKNVTTGKYVQSSVQTLSSLVPMGDTPVEFQIKKDETPGVATNGYYYMASTDQDISLTTDGSLGLNFGATGVVAYYIRTGRGNSYWEIEESDYAYEPPTVEVTDFAKAMQIYSIPCGTNGTAYLTSVDMAGDDVLAELHYTSPQTPTTAFTVFTNQKAQIRQSGTLPIAIQIAGDGAAIRKFAYADWDKDGVFEEVVEIHDGKASFKIPQTTTLGQYRIRIRVTETDTEGAEDDVIGACYDFLVDVVAAETSLTWSVEVNDPTRGEAIGEERNGILYLTAKPLGDAKFVGWRLMHNYFQGETISTDAEYEFPLTQSARLVALFTPNPQPVIDTIEQVSIKTTASHSQPYDIAGRRASQTTRGIVIEKGIKRINK